MSKEQKPPSLEEALALLRQVSPEHGEVIGRHLYTDTMIPSIGNKKAYNDFLSRHKEKGYHVLTDLNNFSEINKLHGNEVGDLAIKRFGEIASGISRKLGLKAFRIGGDELAFHAQSPEQAQAFANELQRTLVKEPKIGSSHNLASAIGIGIGKDQAEKSLIQAKKKLGTYDEATGKRKDYHSPGNAPTTIHFEGQNKAEAEPDPSVPMQLDNPLSKNMAIISTSTPLYPSSTNKSLRETLDVLGVSYAPVEEHFGYNKSALLIGPLKEELAKSLAEDHGQESVIYISDSDNVKLVYVNGPNKDASHAAPGINLLKERPEDNYFYLKKTETLFNFHFNPSMC